MSAYMPIRGATGPTSTVAGATGPTGPTGSSPTGPTGPTSTVAGATGATGPSGPTANAYVKLTADMGTTTTTALANITGLSLDVLSGVYYKFEFGVIYRAAGTTTGLALSVTIPGATIFSAKAQSWSNAADGTDAEFRGRITASGDSVVGTGSQAADTSYLCLIEGEILPSGNGTIQAQYARGATNANVTIKQGSYGILYPIV
jgi:hypothetical protein